MVSLLALFIHAVQSERPSYPSSKPKKKDWDKLEAQMKKEVWKLSLSPFEII